MLGLLLETVAGTAIDTAAYTAKTSAETVAGSAAEGAADIAGILLMSVVEMGVLLPLFWKTVLLSDAWTAVVTVAGTATGTVAENCC